MVRIGGIDYCAHVSMYWHIRVKKLSKYLNTQTLRGNRLNTEIMCEFGQFCPASYNSITI